MAKRAAAVLGDKALARTYMGKAEEQVTSVGEMKSVVTAVKEHYADHAEWVALVEEKLARREANQEKYAMFQEREKAATSTIRLVALADAVMAELEDKFYCQKLLVDAQKRLEQEGWDFAKARRLVQAVRRHLGDSAWAARILKDPAGRMQGFANLLMMAEAAVELLPDRAGARELAGKSCPDTGRSSMPEAGPTPTTTASSPPPPGDCSASRRGGRHARSGCRPGRRPLRLRRAGAGRRAARARRPGGCAAARGSDPV